MTTNKNGYKKFTGYKRAYDTNSTGAKFQATTDFQPPKGDPRKVLFSSGTAVDLLCAMPAIKKRFGDVHGAWEAITREEYEPADENGVQGALREIRFTELPPNENYVETWEAQQRAIIEAVRTAANATLVGAPDGTYTPAKIMDVQRIIQADFDRAILNMLLTKATVEGQYKKDLVNWENRKKTHQKFVQDINKLFNEVFSGQAAVIMERDLADINFCRAYQKLRSSFNVKNGGSTTQSIKQRIATAVFDARKEHLSQHIEKIRNWCDALVMAQSAEGIGRATDETVKDDVINSIMNSSFHATQYKEVIHSINFNDVTPMVALQKLHERAMELSDSRGHRKMEGEVRVAMNDRVEGRDRGPEKACGYCHKPGHLERDCFKKIPCFICKKTGHNPKNCFSLKKIKADNKKAVKSDNDSANNDKNNSSVVLSDKIKKLNGYVMLSLNKNIDTLFEYEYMKAQEDFVKSGKNIDNLTVSHVPAAQSIRKMTSSHWCESDQFALVMCDCHINPVLFLTYTDAIDRIIIDSGATMHMFCNESLLINIHAAEGMIRLGTDGITVPIVGIGGSRIQIIGEVLYAPKLNTNIISVSTLDRCGYETTFGEGKCITYDRTTGMTLYTGTEFNGLYYLDEFYVHMLYGESYIMSYLEKQNITVSGSVRNEDFLKMMLDDPEYEESALVLDDNTEPETTNDFDDDIDWKKFDNPDNYEYDGNVHITKADSHRIAAKYIESNDINPLEILHKKMGHISEGAIKRALKENMIKDCEYTYENIKDLKMRLCFECMKGRMKAFPRNPTTHDNWNTMEKIAIDFKGPFSVQSYHKKRGVMLISDYSSNYVYAYIVRTKAESVEALKDFYKNIIIRYGYKIKVLQSDADCIFKGKRVENWLNLHDINLQLSAPYIHYQNGQIERDVQNVFDKVRTLMLSSDVPPSFWEFAVKTAVYLINRAPTSNRDITPYEAVTKLKPSVAHYVPFWAPGVFHITREERGRNPWDAKAQECRMLSYNELNDGVYEVLNIDTRRVVTRGNCIFDPERIVEVIEEYPDKEIIDMTEGHNDIDIFKELRDEQRDNDISVINDEGSEDEIDIIKEDGYAKPIPVAVDKSYDILKYDEESENESGITDTESMSDFAGMTYWNKRLYFSISSSERWKNDILLLSNKVQPLPPNPKSVDEALAGPDKEKWAGAIDKEVDGFMSRNLWGSADQTGRSMKTKWVLTYKYSPEFEIICKARLVVCGYSQIKGLDYEDTYSPTTTTALIFYILHICSVYRLHKSTFDVSAAFLEGDADVELYAILPGNITNDGQPLRVKINGNWYGEKQAGRVWNKKFDSIMKSMNFIRCPMMPCLYKWKEGNQILFVIVHVDDGLVVATEKNLADKFMVEFQLYITKATHSATFNQYLKMEISDMDDNRIKVSQSEYILSHFRETHRIVHTPMSTSVNLRIQPANPDNESLLPDTGRFRYLADRVRSDILVATGEISIGGAVAPSDEHVKAKDRLIDYLMTTNQVSLILGGSDNIQLFGYSDAAYITDGNAKSRLGGCLFLGLESGAFFSYSRSDTIRSSISHSSTEAEIKAIDELSREVEYWLQILEFTGVNVELPVKIFVDNKSAIELCRVLKTTHQVKHINARIHYINELITSGILELLFVPGEYNVADLLTKGLPRESHLRHSEILLNGHKGKFWNELLACAVSMRMLVGDLLTEITGVCHDSIELEAVKN